MTLRRAFRAALVVIPVGLLINLGVTLAGTDRSVVRSAVALPLRYLFLAALLALVPWLTGTLRLLIWVRFLGIPLSFRESLRMNVASDVGAAVTPTAVGGGLFKWGLLMERGASTGMAASLAALTTIEDVAFQVTSVPIALLLASKRWHPPTMAGHRMMPAFSTTAIVGAILGAVAAWLALRLFLGTRRGLRIRRVLRRMVVRVRAGLRRTWRDAREVLGVIVRRGGIRFVASMGLTGVQWSARYCVPAVLLAYMGVKVDPFLSFALQAFVFLFMAIVPTPGATGGAEAAFLVVYGPLLPRGLVGIVTAAWRFLTFYVQIGLGAVLFLALGPSARSARLRHLPAPALESALARPHHAVPSTETAT